MPPIQATWRQIVQTDDIQRSSQTVSLIDHDVLMFGGEIKPRQPVDNKLYRVSLNGDNTSQTKVNAIDLFSAPSPRVGSASTTVNGKMYLFSGRGGEAMAPIEEDGALYVLDPRESEWTSVTPTNITAPKPEARSYHAMTSDNKNMLYLHAGCPESGRLSDLWAFDIIGRQWKQLADAPGPARGGASIAYLDGKLYRMNGFDGNNEQGFALDVYNISTDKWSTRHWKENEGPSPRSVSTLLTIRVNGNDMLLTMFGECDPSTLGHQGAGKMLSDIWVYDIAQDQWMRVEAHGGKPQSRGWFGADALREKNQVVVQGGLAEDNSRIGDVWTLTF